MLNAVQVDTRTSLKGMMQRLFAVWFDAFVYNQIWEDPRVDLQALELDDDSRILTISSGGCNALNYLVENPASITAVDLNRYHIYLLELKLAALRFLPDHDDFFNFYGFADRPQNLETYQRFIAPKLKTETRNFWESNGFIGNLTSGKRINYFAKGGLYNHSRNGYFLRFFHRFANLIGLHPEEILQAKSIEEQERLFEKNVAPFFDSGFIKLLGRLPVTLFGLGIPPQQFEELKRELKGKQTLIDIYRERSKRLACAYSIEENYFAWQAFARKYDTEKRCALPEYLKAENYDLIKSRANRVKTFIGSVTDQVKQNPKSTFNRFVFLDAQDWMDKKGLNELWSTIAEKGENEAKIIFRTASRESPIEKCLPDNLKSKFFYEKEKSKQLFTQDRSSIYGGFHLYVLKK